MACSPKCHAAAPRGQFTIAGRHTRLTLRSRTLDPEAGIPQCPRIFCPKRGAPVRSRPAGYGNECGVGSTEPRDSREHRFVADAGHELRGPIAALRATGENRAREDLERRVQSAANSSHDWRCSPTTSLRWKPNPTPTSCGVDVDELVWESSYVRGGTQLQVDLNELSPAQVSARESDMVRVIDNLSSKATRYATNCVDSASGKRTIRWHRAHFRNGCVLRRTGARCTSAL